MTMHFMLKIWVPEFTADPELKWAIVLTLQKQIRASGVCQGHSMRVSHFLTLFTWARAQ